MKKKNGVKISVSDRHIFFRKKILTYFCGKLVPKEPMFIIKLSISWSMFKRGNGRWKCGLRRSFGKERLWFGIE